MAHRRGLRGLMLVWAVLQLALPGVATYADALLDRASASAQASHVEPLGTKSCPAVHPADCAICKLVQRVGAASRQPSPIDISASVVQVFPSMSAEPSAFQRDPLTRPRAPPLA